MKHFPPAFSSTSNNLDFRNLCERGILILRFEYAPYVEMTEYRPISQGDPIELRSPVQITSEPTANISSDGASEQPVVVVPNSSQTDSEECQPCGTQIDKDTYPWTPGVWERFPYSGAGSILLIIFCMFVLVPCVAANCGPSSIHKLNKRA